MTDNRQCSPACSIFEVRGSADQAILAGEPLTKIGRRLGRSRDALTRHRDRHMGGGEAPRRGGGPGSAEGLRMLALRLEQQAAGQSGTELMETARELRLVLADLAKHGEGQSSRERTGEEILKSKEYLDFRAALVVGL